MKGKILLAAGIGIGYVLGTRAGRESYEKLKVRAQELWSDPKVQEKVSEVQQTVKEKAPVVQDQAEQAFRKASEGVKSRLNHDDAKPEADQAAKPVADQGEVKDRYVENL
ncbi:YtxH domain-containing protein [Saxibacter everestensis]|uniref:YtxH domain-containing protein n=1 Tax=Saxibacter everestensis TaxID=2909229 RepID=A0ABY8QQE9_9MICO|nr:YtxH domain-containing protein [Brevibacteriaceae bacterium ZFBP1038]